MLIRGFLEKNHSAENFAGKIETIGQSVKKILKQLKCIVIIIIIMSFKVRFGVLGRHRGRLNLYIMNRIGY